MDDVEPPLAARSIEVRHLTHATFRPAGRPLVVLAVIFGVIGGLIALMVNRHTDSVLTMVRLDALYLFPATALVILRWRLLEGDRWARWVTRALAILLMLSAGVLTVIFLWTAVSAPPLLLVVISLLLLGMWLKSAMDDAKTLERLAEAKTQRGFTPVIAPAATPIQNGTESTER
jgi:ABC-type dipeptide/oligopeptide/nickel transport system permease subunit